MSRILLVDDNEEIAYLVKRLLERRGHEVYLALSGREALRQLNTGIRPDIIFLDIIMPGMSGEEFLSRIRSSGKLKDTSVYIFSVVSERERVERWLAMGASGFIPKPYDIKQLEQTIEHSQDRIHPSFSGHGKGEAEG